MPEGHIGILLGDVSGKGFTAALHATTTRHLARVYAFESVSAGEVLERLNRALCAWIEDPELFVTAFYGILKPETNYLRYANAGHWPPLLAGASGMEVIGGHGLVLGACPEATYPEGQLWLNAGDTLLIFSDGLVEVGNR